jgi:hypothetical protein
LSYIIAILRVLQEVMLRLLKCLSPLHGIWWIFEENVQVYDRYYPVSPLWALDVLFLFFCPVMTCIWKCSIQKFMLESIVSYMTDYHIGSLHNRPNSVSHMSLHHGQIFLKSFFKETYIERKLPPQFYITPPRSLLTVWCQIFVL